MSPFQVATQVLNEWDGGAVPRPIQKVALTVVIALYDRGDEWRELTLDEYLFERGKFAEPEEIEMFKSIASQCADFDGAASIFNLQTRNQ
jgi:hypothetical protein